MKSATKHIVISTVLCALTLVVFLRSSKFFLAPQCCSVRRSRGLCPAEPHFWLYRQPERECKAVYVLYHGCCCIRSNGHHDLFGDEVNCPNKNFGGGTVIFFECHFEFFLNKGKECYVTNQELIQKLRCEKGCKQP